MPLRVDDALFQLQGVVTVRCVRSLTIPPSLWPRERKRKKEKEKGIDLESGLMQICCAEVESGGARVYDEAGRIRSFIHS